MFAESLESRSYFAAELAITFDVSHLASAVVAGHSARGALFIDVTDIGSSQVAEKTARLEVNLTLSGAESLAGQGVPDIVVSSERLINVDGMQPEQVRRILVRPHIPASAVPDDYFWNSDAINPAVFSALNIAIDNSNTAGIPPGPITVDAPKSPAAAAMLTAISTPDASGNAMVTITNPTRKPISGPVTFQLFAAVPGQRSFKAGVDVGSASAAFLSDYFSVSRLHLKPHQSEQLPVQLNLEFNPLPFAFTYELFAQQTPQWNDDPSTSTAPALTQITLPANSTAPAPTILQTVPDSRLTGPVESAGGGSVRPTSIEYVDYSFFVDAADQEGLIVTTGIYFEGTPSTSVLLSTAHV